MRLFKKIFVVMVMLLSITAMVISPTFISASESDKLVIHFSGASMTLDEYNPDEVYVEYNTTFDKEIAVIKHRVTHETLEEVKSEVLFNNMFNTTSFYAASSTFNRTFVREKNLGAGAFVEMHVTANVYASYSFRQINYIIQYGLYMGSGYSSYRLEQSSSFAQSSTGSFPTTLLDYGYSGTVIREGSHSLSAGIKAELFGAGFSVSVADNGNTYFRKTFDVHGQINLY